MSGAVLVRELQDGWWDSHAYVVMAKAAISYRMGNLIRDQWDIDSWLRENYPNWPQDPLVFNQLSLDQRGHWRLMGEAIRQSKLKSYLDHHYHADPQGRWYLQNGTQRLFVDLAYTPWVFHFEDSILMTHTKKKVRYVKSAWLDENGTMIFDTEHGPGILREDALFSILELLCDRRGRLMCDNPLDAGLAMHGRPTKPKLFLKWPDRLIPVGWIHSQVVGYKFRFVDKPATFIVA